MSTVDKKLMYQMLRLTKNVIAAAADQKHAILPSDENPRALQAAELTRAVIERGIKTLPLEQRILFNAEQDQRSFERGRNRIVSLLGTWGVMSKEVVAQECEQTLIPHLFDRLIDEDIIQCTTDSSLGCEQEVITLTEAGQELFIEREQVINDTAGSLFQSLNEHEKMHLYLLLRKLMGSPAYESGALPVPGKGLAASA